MDTKERAGKLFSKAIDKSLCCNDIETAIKQVRNEALEEAAKVVDELQEYVIEAINRGQIVGPYYISKAIRDLKEK